MKKKWYFCIRYYVGYGFPFSIGKWNIEIPFSNNSLLVGFFKYKEKLDLFLKVVYEN